MDCPAGLHLSFRMLRPLERLTFSWSRLGESNPGPTHYEDSSHRCTSDLSAPVCTQSGSVCSQSSLCSGSSHHDRRHDRSDVVPAIRGCMRSRCADSNREPPDCGGVISEWVSAAGTIDLAEGIVVIRGLDSSRSMTRPMPRRPQWTVRIRKRARWPGRPPLQQRCEHLDAYAIRAGTEDETDLSRHGGGTGAVPPQLL